MNGFGEYLTKKARPSLATRLVENLLAVTLLLLILACGVVAVFGFLKDGIVWITHLMLAAVMLGLLAVLNALLERKRARMHAELLVEALEAAQGNVMPASELESATGVRDVQRTVSKLYENGYLQGVAVRHGLIGFTVAFPETPCTDQELPAIFHD